eukprot:1818284-Amphidinium_carterae.1
MQASVSPVQKEKALHISHLEESACELHFRAQIPICIIVPRVDATCKCSNASNRGRVPSATYLADTPSTGEHSEMPLTEKQLSFGKLFSDLQYI